MPTSRMCPAVVFSLLLPAAALASDRRCSFDRECPGDELCIEGVCRPPPQGFSAPVPPPVAPAHQPLQPMGAQPSEIVSSDLPQQGGKKPPEKEKSLLLSYLGVSLNGGLRLDEGDPPDLAYYGAVDGMLGVRIPKLKLGVFALGSANATFGALSPVIGLGISGDSIFGGPGFVSVAYPIGSDAICAQGNFGIGRSGFAARFSGCTVSGGAKLVILGVGWGFGG